MTGLPGYPCPVCRRAGGAVTVSSGGQYAQLCSETCAQIYLRIGPVSSDATEEKAIVKGGQAAGEYLERIGKTDLATLSIEEWQTFCLTMFRETCAEMQRIADDEIPF